MKIRALLYITLLVICIIIRLLTWLPVSSPGFAYSMLLCGSLTELAFFGILAEVLRIGKERIVIVILAWIVFLACLVEFISPLFIHHFLSGVPAHRETPVVLDITILVLLKLILYVALFFSRPGPLRILYRWLAIIPIIPVILPHLSYPKHHMPELAITVADTCITLLQYILLIDIVYRTPELQSAEGIDFP